MRVCLRLLRGAFLPPLWSLPSLRSSSSRMAFSPSCEYAHARHRYSWTPAMMSPHRGESLLVRLPQPGIKSNVPRLEHGYKTATRELWW